MKILSETTLGKLKLKNKMAMAPMTRSRANSKGEVTDVTVLYYSQRASAGLIISEGINISNQALGSPYTPGLYTQEQIDAWKKVTKAVHDNGSVIYAQLWHTGRVGHSILKNGELPVAPSAIAIEGQQHFTGDGMKDYETPRALSTKEVKQIVQDYKQAAINAMEAGFDGVELHAAFGYLPNQFLADSANQRTDEYGGSIENRNRFVLEVMEQMVLAIGSDKVGIKLSPTIPYNSIIHNEPTAQFTELMNGLDKMPLAYIHLMNALFPLDKLPHYPKNVLETFGKLTRHTIIANGGYNAETGEEELEKGIAKIISYGALFLANPDLPKRFQLNAELNAADRATMYGGKEKGYTDYPFLDHKQYAGA
ncbi:alkene reductase [Chitinophagaceae bacterium LB-8]|uniref:Alkene reductase n=1 Tax=Paraflavisolibacter caeni TaxID=2982496 RepID=A0A9X3BJY6_9BACT|nr:alkene reductase [Paraflavisolibacter caeni]MCU7551813.1 alkene reductase [Paraflavisolibacter caeni]